MGVAAALLCNLADTPARQRAIGTSGSIEPLVDLLAHRNQDIAAQACSALVNLTYRWDGHANEQDVIRRMLLIQAAGGAPALVHLLASSGHPEAVEAAAAVCTAMLHYTFATDAFLEAGIVAAMALGLQGRQFTSGTHKHVADAFTLLLGAPGPARARVSKAIVHGGGVRALVQVLARPASPGGPRHASPSRSRRWPGRCRSGGRTPPTRWDPRWTGCPAPPDSATRQSST